MSEDDHARLLGNIEALQTAFAALLAAAPVTTRDSVRYQLSNLSRDASTRLGIGSYQTGVIEGAQDLIRRMDGV